VKDCEISTAISNDLTNTGVLLNNEFQTVIGGNMKKELY
jgi:hypothetical protein